MSPNRKIKDEIRISLFGCKDKTQISQIFINNSFENTNNDKSMDEYNLKLEIDRSVIYFTLYDSSQFDDDREKRLMNICDPSNPKSNEELEQYYEDSRKKWNDEMQFANVVLNGLYNNEYLL